MLNTGIKALDFCLPDANHVKTCLKDYKKKWVVLYFYPKDGTPGCSIEALTFSKFLPDFERENAIILGISKDSCESHQKFIKDKKLAIILLSDVNNEVMKLYDVWKPKVFMGHELLGTVRTTYLINPKGEIVYVWPNVNVIGHAETVLNKVKEMKNASENLEKLN